MGETEGWIEEGISLRKGKTVSSESNVTTEERHWQTISLKKTNFIDWEQWSVHSDNWAGCVKIFNIPLASNTYKFPSQQYPTLRYYSQHDPLLTFNHLHKPVVYLHQILISYIPYIGFEKCLMTCSHHNRIRPLSLLNILCVLPTYPLTSPEPTFLFCFVFCYLYSS